MTPRTCDHCHRELRSDAAYLSYCSDTCRRQHHQWLTMSVPQRRRRVDPPQPPQHPGVAAVLADRAAGNRAMSVGQAETVFAERRNASDTARLFAAEEASMIQKLALGRPHRRDLTR